MKEKLSAIDHSWLLALNHLANSSKFWQDIFKFFGVYFIYLVPIILIGLWFWDQKSKKVALQAVFSGLFSWLVLTKIIAYLVKRPRPFESGGIQELIFRRPDFSFPSDHAAFLFAVAASLWFSLDKKLAYFMFAVAIIISIARVGIGAHFPSDIISGAFLGIVGAWIIWLLERPLNYFYNLIIAFYNFLIALARRLKLA